MQEIQIVGQSHTQDVNFANCIVDQLSPLLPSEAGQQFQIQAQQQTFTGVDYFADIPMTSGFSALLGEMDEEQNQEQIFKQQQNQNGQQTNEDQSQLDVDIPFQDELFDELLKDVDIQPESFGGQE
eukprot:TRINITY_DN5476_c1_g1_i2.p5 TRINITY_DN5476_c1_g1~~TRINITY_DN5476_c1_g1_i2.p5  ORF type:complete len:126 (-),score=23.59 TRINITY_DN5476_c1_g1_i2:203-580(-)